MEYSSTVAQMALDEMSFIRDTMSIDRELKNDTPAASLFELKTGDKVLVWREQIVKDLISEWMGPLKVIELDSDKKLVFVFDTIVGPNRLFNVTQVKNYFYHEWMTHSFKTEIARKLEKLEEAE